MADFEKPVITDLYADVLKNVRGMFSDLVKGLDGTDTANVPKGGIRWNSSNRRFEKWDGTTWLELIEKDNDAYNINVDRVDGRDAGNAIGNLAVNNLVLNVNLNADMVDGKHAGTAAGNVLVLDAQGKVPSANLPVVNAANTPFTPVGNVAANNVQAAIKELDEKKQAVLGYSPVNKAGDEMTGRLILKYGDPTIHFKNTGKTGAFIHVNDGRFYVLRSTGIGTDAWNSLPGCAWPLELNLDTGDSYFAGNVFTSTYGWLHDRFTGKAGDTISGIYNNDWYRSNGNAGWYSQSYGGGIYMIDGTWLRIYGGKGFLTDWHQFHPGGSIWTSAYGWLHDAFIQRASDGLYRSGGNVGIANIHGGMQLQNANNINMTIDAKGRVVGLGSNCNCNCNCCDG